MTMRPHILVTAQPVGGLRSVEALRAAIRDGAARELWECLVAEAEADREAPPLVPTSVLPGRAPIQIEKANRDYTICHAAAQRVLRAALVWLVTGDATFRTSSLAQMRVLFDRQHWPIWRDLAHTANDADLRTGQLASALAIAYDWLHAGLSQAERRVIIDGIDTMGIQPYLRSLEQRAFWTTQRSNWLACVVGGLGIAGMALSDDHPQAAELVTYAVEKMRWYMEAYGPEGEFNESPGYAGANRLPVHFFAVLRYHTLGLDTTLESPIFSTACRWVMYMTEPPGHPVPFGDTPLESWVSSDYVAAVAAATRDPLLQGFHESHTPRGAAGGGGSLVDRLLYLDPTVASRAATTVDLPLARAYAGHGGVIASRSDWDPRAAACCVYSKCGLEENHEHHDVGQVLISAQGRRLICDCGSLAYPADFFDRRHRFNYYNAAAAGHNVIRLDWREHLHTGGRLLQMKQGNACGAAWEMELDKLYGGGARVGRSVLHLLPGIVAVLDRVELPEAAEIELRWHTFDTAEPDGDGHFVVRNGPASCIARCLRLDAPELHLSRSEHAYQPPYDTNRLGGKLEQKHESFVRAIADDARCVLLTLFAVNTDSPERRWQDATNGWGIESTQGMVWVSLDGDRLRAAHAHGEVSLELRAGG